MQKHHQFIKILFGLAIITWITSCAGPPVAEETDHARKMLEKINSGCAIAQTADAQGQPVLFWQQVFDDGAHDLAMARTAHGELLEIRRVTFGGSKQAGCHYPGLAIARGGDWGWHLAWVVANVPAGNPALRYARMDGAAWVSSPPKRFGDATARHPLLIMTDAELKLTWQQMLNGKQREMVVVSDDDGRNWR